MPQVRRRRLLSAGASLAGLVAVSLGVYFGGAPGPAAVCEELFELAGGRERASEEVEPAECEAAYSTRLRERGRVGFAALGWCVRFADSLEEAGRC